MEIPVLTDADVDRLADMPRLVRAMTEALRSHAEGRLVAPPRHHVRLADGSLVFTVGGTDTIAGFRAYETFHSGRAGRADEQQIVCVWETKSAKLKGVVLGSRLGELRTGALGGAAIDLLAKEDARICGVIGSGRQAETQIMAAAAVRPLEEIRVFSRAEENRSRFVETVGELLGLTVRPVDQASEAVVGADIVICATNSEKPVFDADWISPGVHVTTVGPKKRGRHELPLSVASRAAVIATDSPAQIAAQGAGHFLAGGDQFDRIEDLAEFALHGAPRLNGSDAITLYLSAGLAGTEVIAADLLLDAHGVTP